MIRVFGTTNETDITNELRALEKICTKAHPNVIEVFQHNWLLPQSMYYIDMELCDLSLYDFIHQKTPLGEPESSAYFTIGDSVQIWNVMSQIASGLEYVHSQGQVQRYQA